MEIHHDNRYINVKKRCEHTTNMNIHHDTTPHEKSMTNRSLDKSKDSLSLGLCLNVSRQDNETLL